MLFAQMSRVSKRLVPLQRCKFRRNCPGHPGHYIAHHSLLRLNLLVPHPINCPGPQPGLLSAPDSRNGTKCKEKHLHVGPMAGDFTHLKTNNDEMSDLPQCPAKSSRSTSNSWKTSHCFRNSEYLSPSDSSSVRPNQSELRHCCGHSLNFCSEALRNRKNNGPGGVAYGCVVLLILQLS